MTGKTSFRTRKSSLYDKSSPEPFKISRSKFFNFLSCKRCFYLDRVIGLKEISSPPYTLNNTVDELLKKEFDYYRKKKIPHPIMQKNKLNFIPYNNENLDTWRNSLTGGIAFHDEKTNLIIHGGIDDLWFNLDNKKIIVVDYKAQSSSHSVSASTYLMSEWRLSYKIQMDIYVFILRKMKFEVSDTSYFYVCNAEKERNNFGNKIDFEVSLIPYKVNTNWIEEKIVEMKETLNCNKIPEISIDCEKCAYLKGGSDYF